MSRHLGFVALCALAALPMHVQLAHADGMTMGQFAEVCPDHMFEASRECRAGAKRYYDAAAACGRPLKSVEESLMLLRAGGILQPALKNVSVTLFADTFARFDCDEHAYLVCMNQTGDDCGTEPKMPWLTALPR